MKQTVVLFFILKKKPKFITEYERMREFGLYIRIGMRRDVRNARFFMLVLNTPKSRGEHTCVKFRRIEESLPKMTIGYFETMFLYSFPLALVKLELYSSIPSFSLFARSFSFFVSLQIEVKKCGGMWNARDVRWVSLIVGVCKAKLPKNSKRLKRLEEFYIWLNNSNNLILSFSWKYTIPKCF